MSWILAGAYCAIIWLVFAKLQLIRLSLPLAILLASLGPSLIVALLLCAQYLHPYTPSAIVFEQVDPIIPQLSRAGRVKSVDVEPNVAVQAGQTLFTVDDEPYVNALKRSNATLAQAKQNIKVAESSVALAEATVTRSRSDLKYATNDRDRNEKLRKANSNSQDDLERSLARFQQAQAQLTQAEQSLTQANLSVEVAKAKETDAAVAVEQAQYDLAQTHVVAPADGFVTNLQLREGMLVGGGTGAVMTFIRKPRKSDHGVVVATFTEKNFLRIKPGQYAEVAMNGYPGQIFTGRVLNTIDVTGGGQLDVTGSLPDSILTGKPSMFAVRIQLDDSEDLRLPGGAQGQAAVYTDDIQIAGIPIMFLIRTKSWMSYVL